ncbi:MAG: Crp/Fnr family transcriptional regulator [Pseudomonadota bacterium]
MPQNAPQSSVSWLETAAILSDLEPGVREDLASLPVSRVEKGTVLFRPGDEVCGFVMIVSGQVGVYLTGVSGREILLYSITPGETCIQSTLGLLGTQDYNGEAIAETDLKIVVVPRTVFTNLLDTSPVFRRFVFHAFAERFSNVMAVLERVAFVKIEQRLAGILMQRADNEGRVVNTHQELATAIGSAREVISRRLETFARKGLVQLERGEIRIVDRPGLDRLAA